MKLLFDTNVLIPAEPTSPDEQEQTTLPVTELLRTAMSGKHQVYVHPESVKELSEDRDGDRRNLRLTLVQKYVQLPAPPQASQQLLAQVGLRKPRKHDKVDLALLSAVKSDAIDFLVTEDRRLLKRAVKAGLAARVISIDEALKALRALFSKTPAPPPSVRLMVAHELNELDPIFESLREDYPGFDDWLKKCKREHRVAWVVEDENSRYAGVCIVKDESTGEHNLRGKVLKICTYKISLRAFGRGYGELLLRTVFEYVLSNKHEIVYVEALPKYVGLITLLETFGFTATKHTTPRGECVLVKKLSFTQGDYVTASPLDFNIRFGPLRVKTTNVRIFVVPVRPNYFKALFPTTESQQELFRGVHPSGNAIRKAYICHSNLRTIQQGDLLLFYRSQDIKSICGIGVVEISFRSSDPMRIARLVGTRTVYPYSVIERMCNKPLLALLFRFAYSLSDPISLSEIIQEGALVSAPQSIVTVRMKGSKWLQNRLAL